MFETKPSVNQDFINCYSRIIRINTQFKLHRTHQYTAKDLNQFYQDYLKLIQSFNLIQCAVQEQIKMIRKGFKKKRHNQFLYWFTTQGYIQSSLHHLQRKFH